MFVWPKQENFGDLFFNNKEKDNIFKRMEKGLMFSIINNRKATYGVRQFLCDTEADVANLPSSSMPGSIAYVITSGQKYILNHTKDWVIDKTTTLVENNNSIISPPISNELEQAVNSNARALAILNGDGEGSVSKTVKDAITDLIDGAPETLDTLKELADEIKNQEKSIISLSEDEIQNIISSL